MSKPKDYVYSSDELADLFFKEINWQLLRDQKLALIRLRNTLSEDKYAFLDGILHLIDHVQDVAVESQYCSEEEVFNLN